MSAIRSPLTIFCLALLIVASIACEQRKVQPSTNKASSQKEAAPKDSSATKGALQQLLEAAPAKSNFIGALTRVSAFYRVFGNLEGALMALPASAKMVRRIRAQRATAPFPIPWTQDEFKALGLDDGGLIAVVNEGRKGTWLMFTVRDPKAFKASFAKLGEWKVDQTQGDELAHFRGRRGQRASCHFAKGRAICAPQPEVVLAAHRRPAAESLWQRLSKEQRQRLGSGSAFFWAEERMMRGNAVVTVTGDGLKLDAKLQSPAFARTGQMFGKSLESDPRKSPLFALLANAASRLYMRVPLSALLRQSGLGGAKKMLLGLNNLTGEVVALERKNNALALVVGTQDGETAQRLLELAVVTARGQLANRRASAKAPKTEFQETTVNGKKAFMLSIRNSKPPVTLEVMLAAGPRGIVAGSKELVTTLVSTSKSTGSPKLTPAEQAGLKAGGILALTLALSDPLAAVMGQAKGNLLKDLPAKSRRGITIGRYLFDLLHSVSMSQVFKAPSGLHITMTLHTLHRDGEQADDGARDIYRRALAAKYAGDTATFQQQLEALKTQHANTRFGGLKERQQGALFTTATGIMAAVAIPAFIKYLRKSKAMEARTTLYRLGTTLKLSYQHQALERGPKAKDLAFPKGDTGWTPKDPCCKQPAGRCDSRKSFEHPIWKALRFRPFGPHYYQYRYVGKGKGKRARFTISARGDLDCDGVTSLFTMEGSIGPRGRVLTTPPRAKAETE